MHNKQGFVLVVMLLFLLVLNLLVMTVLDIDVVESKMERAYHDKIQAFYSAENRLLLAEHRVLAGGARLVGVDGVDVDIVSSEICGVEFYRITAAASWNGAKSLLQSTVAKMVDAGHCEIKPNVAIGRHSFLIRS